MFHLCCPSNASSAAASAAVDWAAVPTLVPTAGRSRGPVPHRRALGGRRGGREDGRCDFLRWVFWVRICGDWQTCVIFWRGRICYYDKSYGGFGVRDSFFSKETAKGSFSEKHKSSMTVWQTLSPKTAHLRLSSKTVIQDCLPYTVIKNCLT